MSTDNLTAILYGINDIRLEQTEIEDPCENEVLLKMGCIGICGSDIHYLVNGRIGDFIVQQPMIIGHESSGTVIKLGSNVKNLKIGDRVAIEPGIPCRTCKFCKMGRYNLCKDIKFCATPPVHGSLRRYYKHAADFCFKLPDNVSLEEGALIEPLSVCVHACKRANIGIGSCVLILGAGSIGLLTLLTAKSMGAKTVIIADLVNYRLDIAKKLKANEIYLLKNEFTQNDHIKNIHKLFRGYPDIVIDASGAESSIQLAIMICLAIAFMKTAFQVIRIRLEERNMEKVIKRGGTVVLVGMGSTEVKLPFFNILIKEIDIRGVFRYANNYPDALDLVSKNKIDIGAIVTHRYKLEETLKAFDTSKLNSNNPVKIIIYCD